MMQIMIFLKKFFSNKSIKSFTVVSVGPGDPSLLTIAAINAIKKADVIFYPTSGENKKSFSAEIVKNHIKFKEKIPIIFPMASKEIDPEEIWSIAADKIIKCLMNKKSSVLLCLGDSSVYASSSYIVNKIIENYPDILVRKIPGISSFSAAAAINKFDLVKQGEVLKILECPNQTKDIENLIKQEKVLKSVLVIMKIGKRWNLVRDILLKEKIIDKALLAMNIGMKNQIIEKASIIQKEDMPYFSLLLIRF